MNLLDDGLDQYLGIGREEARGPPGRDEQDVERCAAPVPTTPSKALEIGNIDPSCHESHRSGSGDPPSFTGFSQSY
jgi:hypothetical protein